MDTHLKICVDKIFDLPSTTSTNKTPFVRLRLGNLQGESHSGVRIPGAVSDYDIYNHIVFENFDENAPLVTEIVDGETLGILASTSLPKWKSLLKDNKRHLMLDLRPASRVKMDLKVCYVEQKFPSHFTILVGSASDLSYRLAKSPVAEVHVGNYVWTTNVGKSPLATNTKFEWNESHLMEYHGERALEIYIREKDESSIDPNNVTSSSIVGMCRYDLWELCAVRNSSSNSPKHVVGKVCLTDFDGTPVGNIKIGLSLGDGSGSRKGQNLIDQRNRLAQEYGNTLDKLKERRKVDGDLLEACFNGFESPAGLGEGKKGFVSIAGPHLSTVRVNEVESKLSAADSSIEAGDRNLTDMTSSSSDLSRPDWAAEKLKISNKELKRNLKDADKHLTVAERGLQMLTYQTALVQVEAGRSARARMISIAKDVKNAEELLYRDEKNEDVQFLELKKASEKVQELLVAAGKQEEALSQNLTSLKNNQKKAGDLLTCLRATGKARDEMIRLLREMEKYELLFSRQLQNAKLEQRRSEHILNKALMVSPIDTKLESKNGLCPCRGCYSCCCCC